jgi:hypothetical protein
VYFHCPNCNALYHLISAEAGPETIYREGTLPRL